MSLVILEQLTSTSPPSFRVRCPMCGVEYVTACAKHRLALRQSCRPCYEADLALNGRARK